MKHYLRSKEKKKLVGFCYILNQTLKPGDVVACPRMTGHAIAFQKEQAAGKTGTNPSWKDWNRQTKKNGASGACLGV